MKMTRGLPFFPSMFLAMAVGLLVTCVVGAPPVLRWDPSVAGNVWTVTATNWLDSEANAVAWVPGAEAKFESATGGLVQIAAPVSVSNLTFTGSGYTLLGAGRLRVEGSLSCEAATTNCIAAELVTVGGLTKSGGGALALARCAGPLVVQVGSVLASGSAFVDADLSVASGAALVTLGDPATNFNLIANGGFELPALANGAWSYTAPSNWTATANPSFVGRQNTAPVSGYSNPWNAAGTSPEGVQMMILQYGGTVAQTVIVPTAGLYGIAFSFLMRNDNRENQVYVTLDGAPLATFLNRSAQFSPGRFSSGALWLSAGSHTLGIGGEHSWGDRSTMVDAVCFAAPSSANVCRAFSGDSLLKAVSGASVVLSHTGTVPLVYVALDGFPASGTFNVSHTSGIFSGSGALSCDSLGSVYTWSGSGLWSDPVRWVDGAVPAAGGGQSLLVRFPAASNAASTNNLAGEFLTRRLWASGIGSDGVATLAGNALVFTNAAPLLSQTTPGAWHISAPVYARTPLTLDVAGDVTFQGNALGLVSNATFYKSGPGTVTIPSFTNLVASAVIYEGKVQTPQIPSSLVANLFSQAGKSAVLTLTQGGGSLGNTINLMGSGLPALQTSFGGGSVTLNGYPRGFGDVALFDVGADDTLSIPQMLLQNTSRGNSTTALLKSGAGVLEIRAGGTDNSNNRAYQGRTVLRNGQLTLSEDDYGTLVNWTNPFNGRTYSGFGGSLGFNVLTNSLLIGDSYTAASDNLTLVANGNGRWIGHDIEIFNKGHDVTLKMTAGTVMFGGTVTLHRDITLSGPAGGFMIFTNVVASADFAGTGLPTLSGLAGLRFEGAFPATASLNMGARALRFGTYAVRAQTLKALSLGTPAAAATLDVDFGAGVNDTLAVTMNNGLTLSNTVVNLYYAGSGLPFAEPGIYTLFTYSGTLGGDAALLSVGNPQGVSYVFTDDAVNHRVTLTISGTSGGVGAVWVNNGSGDWGVGANWNSGGVPGGPGIVPLFGLAITNSATVAIGAARTVGGLLFNNAAYGYTLAGSGGLTLATNGATPLVSVLAGKHMLDTALSGTDGLEVSTVSDAVLILGPSTVGSTGMSLSQGTVELQGNAAVNGPTVLGASTLLRALSTANAAIGSLSGASSSAMALAGTAPKLTVNQGTAGTFAGMLSGVSSAQFIKSGSGTLTLSGPVSPLLGQAKVGEGTLALRSASLSAAVAVDAASVLSVASPATNGLTGFFYNVAPNTNNFWTLAAMESHFASLTPDFGALSGATSNLFDFGVGTTFFFPAPYGSGGTRSTNFEVAWRGSITLPATGSYIFGVYGDDGFLLAIDGKQILARNYWLAAWTEGIVTLDAGRHDIVLGYFQLTSGGGLQMRVRQPSQTAAVPVPNAWLTPYSQTGPLSGGGSLALGAPDALLRAALPTGGATYGGAFTGVSGGLLAKSGNGILSLGGGGAVNAFAGNVDVQGGLLSLVADERINDAATLNMRSGATLALVGTETVGAVAGGGTLSLGDFIYTMPFTSDADSDISTAKTYTHLLDFPANGNPATVNGVLFTAADMSGSAGGYSWSSVNPPTGVWNDAPNDATRTGIDRLLWDFIYGSMDFTLTLSNLTPGKAYETRLYFRNFASNTRYVTLTFTAGAHEVGSLYCNPDSGLTGTRSWVGCRYTADSAGTVTVRVLSHVTNDKCHLYGLSNEELAGSASPVLTVASATGASAKFEGSVTGSGTLVKTGAGTQRFGGANMLLSPLDVREGAAVLDAGAFLLGGANVTAGAVLKAPLGNVTLGALTGQGTFALTGIADYVATNGPHFVKITGDVDCGISPDKTYTHLIDFGGNAALSTVNGVAFNKERTISGPSFGCSWVNAPATTAHSGGNTANIGVPSNQGIYNLLNDFCYGGPYGPTVMTLTGLTTGKTYEVRFYHRKWEADRARNTTFTFDPDGAGPISNSISFNPDSPAGVTNYNDNYLAYRYFAQTNQLAVTITCPNPDRYHIYGLSNEEVPGSLDGSTVLNITNSCVFAGAITGGGLLTKAGSGSLTLTGTSTATGAVSVAAGTFGVASNGRATLGSVGVLSGATLFGHGQVGGNVIVASNAWLQGGTVAACGSLAVGGDLTLLPGVRLAWRYAAGGSNDTVTVGGLLTFPTNGTVQVSALTTDLMPPAKALFFASPQPVNGPADLTGWTVEGVQNASLRYSDDRTKIYFFTPRGTLILLH